MMNEDAIERFVDSKIREWWRESRNAAFDHEQAEAQFDELKTAGYADLDALKGRLEESLQRHRTTLVRRLKWAYRENGELGDLDEIAPDAVEEIRIRLRRFVLLEDVYTVRERGVSWSFLPDSPTPGRDVELTEKVRRHCEAVVQAFDDNTAEILEEGDMGTLKSKVNEEADGKRARVAAAQRALRNNDFKPEKGNPEKFVDAVQRLLEADALD